MEFSTYQQIIGMANNIAGEDVSHDYPHTITGALDALADVLAGEDVDGGHTIAEAVAAVGENIGGGGGGQATPMYVSFPASYETPIVSAMWKNGTDTGTVEISEPFEIPEYELKCVTVTAPAGVLVYFTLASGLCYGDAAYSQAGEEPDGFPAAFRDQNSTWTVWYTQPCLVGEDDHFPIIFLGQL